MIDFGDGRIRAGMERLPEPGWLNLAGSLTREGAHLVVEKAPTEFKRRQEAFAPVSGVCHLSSRLKEALDPTGVFAPGRLPGRN